MVPVVFFFEEEEEMKRSLHQKEMPVAAGKPPVSITLLKTSGVFSSRIALTPTWISGNCDHRLGSCKVNRERPLLSSLRALEGASMRFLLSHLADDA